MTAVRESLVAAVGEDAAVSVALWLSDVLDDHSLEVDDQVVPPSLPWLLDAIKRCPRCGSTSGHVSNCTWPER